MGNLGEQVVTHTASQVGKLVWTGSWLVRGGGRWLLLVVVVVLLGEVVEEQHIHLHGLLGVHR